MTIRPFCRAASPLTHAAPQQAAITRVEVGRDEALLPRLAEPLKVGETTDRPAAAVVSSFHGSTRPVAKLVTRERREAGGRYCQVPGCPVLLQPAGSPPPAVPVAGKSSSLKYSFRLRTCQEHLKADEVPWAGRDVGMRFCQARPHSAAA